MQSGDNKDAAKDFKYVYALAPQFKQLASIGAAGNVLAGDNLAAQAILQKAFGTTVVDSQILLQAYVQTKQYKPVIAIFKQRLVKNGSTANDFFRLAVIEAASGNTRSAVAYVRTAMKKYPKEKQAGKQLIKQINSGAIAR